VQCGGVLPQRTIIIDQGRFFWQMHLRRQADVSIQPPPKGNAAKGVGSNLSPETENMLRIIALAATAAILIAAPASAQTIKVSTAGKTPAQVQAEVYKAAHTLCALDTFGASYAVDAERACVVNTVRATLSQAKDPALLQMASAK
jgi:hypothetical protein